MIRFELHSSVQASSRRTPGPNHAKSSNVRRRFDDDDSSKRGQPPIDSAATLPIRGRNSHTSAPAACLPHTKRPNSAAFTTECLCIVLPKCLSHDSAAFLQKRQMSPMPIPSCLHYRILNTDGLPDFAAKMTGPNASEQYPVAFTTDYSMATAGYPLHTL